MIYHKRQLNTQPSLSIYICSQGVEGYAKLYFPITCPTYLFGEANDSREKQKGRQKKKKKIRHMA